MHKAKEGVVAVSKRIQAGPLDRSMKFRFRNHVVAAIEMSEKYHTAFNDSDHNVKLFVLKLEKVALFVVPSRRKSVERLCSGTGLKHQQRRHHPKPASRQ